MDNKTTKYRVDRFDIDTWQVVEIEKNCEVCVCSGHPLLDAGEAEQMANLICKLLNGDVPQGEGNGVSKL